MIINDRKFFIALLKGCNLDKATKINFENVGPNKGTVKTETRTDLTILEQTIIRSTVTEKPTTKSLWETEARVKEEKEVTNLRKEELVSKEDV